mmetsp:Transcript_10069/g.32070  ORF Transcript_10069/g.32070 Transcript_10069/m.32070 type:complete len:87 (-) Transcript_10069:723-983(-)
MMVELVNTERSPAVLSATRLVRLRRYQRIERRLGAALQEERRRWEKEDRRLRLRRRRREKADCARTRAAPAPAPSPEVLDDDKEKA